MEKSIKIRNSSIESLKLLGILLIVISHVVQTLGKTNVDPSYTYPIDLTLTTTDIQHLIVSMFQYSGTLGNTIFFVCSAWFLVRDDDVSKRKIFTMLADIWVVSVIILCILKLLDSAIIGGGYTLRALLPTYGENNWYMNCYLIFYAIHPFLNLLIKKINQRTLLRFVLISVPLYYVIAFSGIIPKYLFGFGGSFFASYLTTWIVIYFLIAYMSIYASEFWANKHFNIILFLFGFVGNYGLIGFSNYLGLRVGIFRETLQLYNTCYNPFMLAMVLGLFNLIRQIDFENKVINYISKLSLFIYIIHENFLLKSIYRPKLWQYIYIHMEGQNHILACVGILTVIVFLFGLICSIVYYESVHKLVVKTCNKFYPRIALLWRNLENKAMQLH